MTNHLDTMTTTELEEARDRAVMQLGWTLNRGSRIAYAAAMVNVETIAAEISRRAEAAR